MVPDYALIADITLQSEGFKVTFPDNSRLHPSPLCLGVTQPLEEGHYALRPHATTVLEAGIVSFFGMQWEANNDNTYTCELFVLGDAKNKIY